MRLASLRAGGRDGRLVVVRRDGAVFASAETVCPTMQRALDDWDRVAPALREIAARLDDGRIAGEPLDVPALAAPLPRAYEWIDGSAFRPHVERARRARGAPMPDRFVEDPLVYQGGSGVLLGARDDVRLAAVEHGLDLEAELAVVLGDVPVAVAAASALEHVRLVCLVNDWTLRALVPSELAKGFGFLVSKPPTAFGPFAVTPDELGEAWRDGRAQLVVEAWVNGERLGACDAAEMDVSFAGLIEHVARTRPLVAGTLLGSGTVANADASRGTTCLVERRALETIAHGAPRTRWLGPGDVVRITARDASGRDVFGTIEQKVVAA